MKNFALSVVAMSLFAGVLLASPGQASAVSLTICNRTNVPIGVAVGYASSGINDTSTVLSGPFVSHGFWGVASGACYAAANPFNARYMFWWGYNQNGDLWPISGPSNYYFCAANTSGVVGHSAADAVNAAGFTFEDENVSATACGNAAPGDSLGPNKWVPARRVDLDVSPTVTFMGQ